MDSLFSISTLLKRWHTEIQSKDVDKNSSFVELWPAGKWGSGSLPSDVKQDLKIERLEMQMTRLTDKIYGNGQ